MIEYFIIMIKQSRLFKTCLVLKTDQRLDEVGC